MVTPPLPHYTFMAWCSVKAQGQLYLYLLFTVHALRCALCLQVWSLAIPVTAPLTKVRQVFTFLLAATLLAGKHDRERQLGRPRRRMKDNIGLDIRETGREIVDSIHLA
jgi:hypothetical protein